MVRFDFKGIKVEATAKIERNDYTDASNRQRARFDRIVKVTVEFWKFKMWQEDLLEFASVKSTLQYFTHAYWKRTSKQGSKISLAKCLHHNDQFEDGRSLSFNARQKNNEQYLHIFTTTGGKIENEVYLDVQEVMALDIAMGKAISLMAPAVYSPHGYP